MTITTKKSGAYVAPVGVFVKKGGVYAAVKGIYAKVGGAYQLVSGAAVLPYVLLSDAFPLYGSAEKAFPYEPQRLEGTIKNNTLGPIYVAQNADFNYQKNRPSSGYTTVLPGQEYYSTDTNMTYCKSQSGTSSAATWDGTKVMVTLNNHGFVVGQNILVRNAVPAAYNTPGYPGYATITDVPDAGTFKYVPQSAPSGPATTQLTIDILSVVTVERKVAK